MPSRVIRGEILKSQSLALVSPEAEFFCWRLLIAVDEWGRIEADPHLIRAEVFPRRPQIGAEDVQRWIDELCNLEPEDAPLRRYTVGRRSYLCFPKWEALRGKSKRGAQSKIPAPSADGNVHPRTSAEGSACSGSGVGSGGGEGGGGALAVESRGNPREPEHPLVDASRADLDTTAPPERLTDEQLDQRTALQPKALQIADTWARHRRKVDPKDPLVERGAWSIHRKTLQGRLLPHLERYGAEVVESAIEWGMQHLEPGFSWRAVLRDLASVEQALTAGHLVEQWRAAMEAERKGRENGHARTQRGPEPPDYQAQRKIREAEEAQRAAEAKAAVAPPPAAREALRRIAGASP